MAAAKWFYLTLGMGLLLNAGCSGGEDTQEPTASPGVTATPGPTQTEAEPTPTATSPDATQGVTPTAGDGSTPTPSGDVMLSTTLRTASTGTPLTGLQICQTVPKDGACATSNEKGEVSLPLPANSQVLLHTVPASHSAHNFTVSTKDGDSLLGIADGESAGVSLVSSTGLETLATAAGQSLNKSDGSIRVRVIEASGEDSGTAAQTFLLNPPKGSGPFYVNDKGEIEGALSATSPAGVAWYFNVPPGDYALAVKTSSATCAAETGAWGTNTADSFALTVHADEVTWVEIVCAPVKDRAAHRARAAADTWAALSDEITAAWMSRHTARSMKWNWKEAVLMIGMQAAWARSQDPAILDYTKAWIDYHMDKGYRVHSSDSTVPATSAAFLYDTLGDPTYLAPVEEGRAYLAERAPYLDDGTVAHATFVPNQAWVDSLFMLGSFYTWDARYTGSEGALSTAAVQFRQFHGHLFAERRGLYWHMYNEAIDQHVPASLTFWGRGNGWALASLALLLSEMPADHPERGAMEALFKDHADGVLTYQNVDGMWHTVINDDTTYPETSATALFTFGLLRGVNLGLLGTRAREAGRLGLAAIEAQIIYDDAGLPIITNISKATNPGPHAYYANVPLGEDEPYGVGAVLLALEEGATL